MKVAIYGHSADVPALPEGSFFHSLTLMQLCERTPRHKPYMAVVTDDDGRVKAHLLGIMRFHSSWFPPYLYTHVRIYGDNGSSSDDFGLMIGALTERLQNRTLYMEVSHLSEKMFGYRYLRRQGYFPVRWMNVHNSLHSRTPEERITERQMRRIELAQKRGIMTKQVDNDQEFQAAFKLLRHHHWLKPRRYLPADSFFRGMMESGSCKIFISQFREHVVGVSVLVLSGKDCYLWYSASRRKSFALLYPHTVTVWETIKWAHANGREHIRFMDVGLPFRKNLYRDFIMRFGGKETSTYRWFRISIRWVNRLASWLWRE